MGGNTAKSKEVDTNQMQLKWAYKVNSQVKDDKTLQEFMAALKESE